jgi:hypothetical protein
VNEVGGVQGIGSLLNWMIWLRQAVIVILGLKLSSIMKLEPSSLGHFQSGKFARSAMAAAIKKTGGGDTKVDGDGFWVELCA